MDYKAYIKRDNGEVVEASAPVIISASRATDIPAFYAKWFMNRLRAGYCIWYNPFNQKPMYISFAKTKVVVFWTKNPEPMIPFLPELDKMGIHYYFQVTLNDYVNEGFEPNVGPVEHRVEVFKRLANLIGKEKVIWRFDPLIVTPKLTARQLLSKTNWFSALLTSGPTARFKIISSKKLRFILARPWRMLNRAEITLKSL